MSTTTPAPRSAEPALAPDYTRFCAGVKTLVGIDLIQYKPGQMERRLRSFAARAGLTDLDAYLALLRRDPRATAAFLDHMTINVSELFRNPERFEDLERIHIPELLASAAGRGLRVWSAACSYGAEPYSLAILLREAAPRAVHDVVGTDIDRTILARAREGRFGEPDMKNVSRARRATWFTDTGSGDSRASGPLRAMVRFSRLDLLGDPYPRSRDLIVCRNVVIYLNEDAKERIYDRFYEALRPGGILFVGSTERVNEHARMGWERPGNFFYRRPA